MGGVQTLRVTAATNGINLNYFMLVPATLTPPRLTISGSPGGISWTGSGFILEFTDRLGGSWAAVTNQTNPYPLLPTGSAGFYRLRQ